MSSQTTVLAGRGKVPGSKLVAFDAAGGNLPFQSLEAEEALISCCLIDEGETVRRCLRAGIADKAFYSPAMQFAWRMIVRVVEAGHAVTREAVEEESRLQDATALEEYFGYGGWDRVAGLMGTTGHAGYFLAKVLDLWNARKARWWLMQAAERLQEGAGDWKATWAGLENVISEIGRLRPTDGPATGVERFDARTAWWERVGRGELDVTRRLGFGLPRFEKQCRPVDVDREHFLNVIAARASGGKSTLARQVVDVGLRAGQRFQVFLLETTCDYWLDLMAASRAGVSLDGVEEGPPDFLRRLQAERVALRPQVDRELFLHENVFELDDLLARARDLHRRLADQGGLHGIVVDYLQQVQVRRLERAPREQQVAHISRQLKLLAKELRVPVLALAQLNRGSEKEERRPRKSDLRESGALEQDADRIMILHTPKVDMRGVEQSENQDRVMSELLQVKSRNGSLGAFRLWFDRPVTRFSEVGVAEERAEDGGRTTEDRGRRTEGGGERTVTLPRPGAAKPKGGYGRGGSEW